MEEPQVDALLGDISPGMTIADIGCGTGRHAIRLAMRGADVTALDFSEEMLNKAREKLSRVELAPPANNTEASRCLGFTTQVRLRLLQHDLSKPLPLENQSFDGVLCSLVLDHIPDLSHVFAEVKRIVKTKPALSIIVSNMHPAMMLRGVQARFTDPATGRETRPASCRHQISDYVMAANGAGLTIDHLSEHLADENLVRRCPRAEKYLGWPLLLMMRLRP